MQLLDFLESTEQLNSSGHAYRAGLSTTTTIAQICEELYESAERKNIASLMTVDQSVAFDSLNHEIFIGQIETVWIGTRRAGLGERLFETESTVYQNRSRII